MPDATRPEFTPEQIAEVRRLQGLYPSARGALLPVLHMAQDTFGYVSLEVEEYVAGLFDLSAAHVHEVVTFYTLFFQQPPGRHVVSVCHNLSCHLMGSKSTTVTRGCSRPRRWTASSRDCADGRERLHPQLRPAELAHPRGVPGDRGLHRAAQGARDGAGRDHRGGEEVEPPRA